MKSYDLYSIMKQEGYTFFAGVPCSYFTSLYNHLLADQAMTYVAAANEGLSTSICAGAVLAGKKAAIIIQNSGFGNIINPLTSLCMPFDIPLLFFISGRAYQIDDEPQHKIMGKTMHKMLSNLGISVFDLPEKREEAKKTIEMADSIAMRTKNPVAIIVKKDLLEQDNEKNIYYPVENRKKKKSIDLADEKMSRTTALETIARQLTDNDAVITTTGTSSREFFTLCDRLGNFYMQGSLGHAAGIGLGIALSSSKRVVIIDGDGALLMHLGILSTIGFYQPKNLLHIVIDNEQYESTGGQATTPIDFAAAAETCHYIFTGSCATTNALRNMIEEASPGPALIHAKVGPSEIKKLPRITETLSCPDITARFSGFLRT